MSTHRSGPHAPRGQLLRRVTMTGYVVESQTTVDASFVMAGGAVPVAPALVPLSGLLPPLPPLPEIPLIPEIPPLPQSSAVFWEHLGNHHQLAAGYFHGLDAYQPVLRQQYLTPPCTFGPGTPYWTSDQLHLVPAYVPGLMLTRRQYREEHRYAPGSSHSIPCPCNQCNQLPRGEPVHNHAYGFSSLHRSGHGYARFSPYPTRPSRQPSNAGNSTRYGYSNFVQDAPPYPHAHRVAPPGLARAIGGGSAALMYMYQQLPDPAAAPFLNDHTPPFHESRFTSCSPPSASSPTLSSVSPVSSRDTETEKCAVCNGTLGSSLDMANSPADLDATGTLMVTTSQPAPGLGSSGFVCFCTRDHSDVNDRKKPNSAPSSDRGCPGPSRS